MRALLFAVLSVVFVSSAHAECYTPPQVTAGIIKVVAGSTVAEAPKGFVEAFNAVPPVTAIVADHVLIFTHKSKTNALVAMFNRGCWVASQQIPIDKLRSLLSQLENDI